MYLPTYFAACPGNQRRRTFITNDGTAHGSAELILMERRPGLACRIGEKIVRVERVVSQELECGAVNLIRAAFDCGVNHRAGGVAELGRKRAGLYLELLH